jgi:predicted nucleic acid-binding Zn ribbon protein
VPDRSRDDHPQVTGSDVRCPTSGDNPVDSVDNAVTFRASGRLERADSPGLEPREGTGHDRASGAATESDYPQLRGPDLARAALQAAKEASGGRPGQSGKPGATQGKKGKQAGYTGSRRRRRWSGASPDDRDPQPLGRLASRLATQRGWTGRLTTGQLFGRWSEIVGEDVAEHARPLALKDGELTVQADSTAWATQLRLLQRQLLAKIAAGVGNGVVKRLKVHGPSTPSWRYGPRHVRGRGPRDTYG